MVHKYKAGVILIIGIISVILVMMSLFYSQSIISSIKQKNGNSENLIRMCEGNNIALTFDDGPNEYTKDVLKILKKNNVSATFFLLGKNIENYPETVKLIKDEGHLIGTHTYSHERLTELNMTNISFQISTANQLLKEVTMVKPIYFRPPHGSYNDDVLEYLESDDMILVLWSYSSLDWLLPGFLMNIHTNNIQEGDIVSLHDLEDTADYLDKIIKKLKSKNYSLVAINECVKVGG